MFWSGLSRFQGFLHLILFYYFRFGLIWVCENLGVGS
jgi:hypothetical protein